MPWGFHHTEVAIGQGLEKLLLGKGRPKSGREGLKLHLLKQKENRTSSLTELGNGILCPHWLAPDMAALRLWGPLLWSACQHPLSCSPSGTHQHWHWFYVSWSKTHGTYAHTVLWVQAAGGWSRLLAVRKHHLDVDYALLTDVSCEGRGRSLCLVSSLLSSFKNASHFVSSLGTASGSRHNVVSNW